MSRLQGRTVLVTGASRGIGRAIALQAAHEGANVVLMARNSEHLSRAAADIEAAGGSALSIAADVCAPASMEAAINAAVERFGGVDALVNNAGALHLRDVRHTPLERFSELLDVNLRGSYEATRACLHHLGASSNPHVLNLAPPLNLSPRWFEKHTPYTVSKYALSLLTIGLHAELRHSSIAVNALWPRTVIYTGADERLPGVEARNCRTPAFVGMAAVAILVRASTECSGNFFFDEEVLRQAGVTDFKPYAVSAGQPLMADYFVD